MADQRQRPGRGGQSGLQSEPGAVVLSGPRGEDAGEINQLVAQTNLIHGENTTAQIQE